jgi:hypothetical protein
MTRERLVVGLYPCTGLQFFVKYTLPIPFFDPYALEASNNRWTFWALTPQLSSICDMKMMTVGYYWGYNNKSFITAKYFQSGTGLWLSHNVNNYSVSWV